ncbi:MAG: class I SAM-dependent methyltransferase [Thermoplasmatota archaeon]
MAGHNGHSERHEHQGMTSKGLFDDEEVLRKIGVGQGQTFLDGGCSDGHFSLAASRLVGEQGHVYAYDIYRPFLEELQQMVKGNDLKNITVEAVDLRGPIPVKDSSLDHFFMANVLHGFVYNGEQNPVLKSALRTLKPGGKLSLIEWDKDFVDSGPPKDHRLSYDDAKEILAPYGFKPLSVEKSTPRHLLMVFVK